jgi:hypothetical protein
MKGYFYITKNLINGKFYYGSGTVGNENRYFGSNSNLDKARKKYGDDNFEHIPLKYFENREDAYIFEDRFLKLYKISKNPMSYNMKDSGRGGDTIKNHPNRNEIIKKRNNSVSRSLKGHKISEETKKKISRSNKGRVLSEETKKKISESAKINGISGGNRFSNRTEEQMKITKKKLSESAKRNNFGGDNWSTLSPEEKEVRSKKISNSRKGKPLSEETKNKIRESIKGKQRSEETKQKIKETLKNKYKNGII